MKSFKLATSNHGIAHRVFKFPQPFFHLTYPKHARKILIHLSVQSTQSRSIVQVKISNARSEAVHRVQSTDCLFGSGHSFGKLVNLTCKQHWLRATVMLD